MLLYYVIRQHKYFYKTYTCCSTSFILLKCIQNKIKITNQILFQTILLFIFHSSKVNVSSSAPIKYFFRSSLSWLMSIILIRFHCLFLSFSKLSLYLFFDFVFSFSFSISIFALRLVIFSALTNWFSSSIFSVYSRKAKASAPSGLRELKKEYIGKIFHTYSS